MTNLTINTKYRMPSGHEIPALGYGVYQTPADITSEVVQHALKVGYRHVDSAVAYRNEANCAEGMKKSGIPREELFFTTKIPPKNLCYETAKEHIENTLKITGFDYVDLYLLHSPYGGKEGRLGAWKALVEGVQAGKIRSIGVSNYGVHHLDELEAWIKETEKKEGPGSGGILDINQIELHPWLARPDITEWCKKRGVLCEAYCPIVRATKNDDPLLLPLAKKYNKTPSQILIRWSLQMGFVPLPKSVTKSRIEENAQVYDFELTKGEMESLDTGVYESCSWDPTTSHD
ncbi:2,5-diketo-D-gluconic acid reductase A [Cucurbitaria berberidis CBS 394.84]|uniref:2,5-diketo-D-gluconic acid reductase A n=1 Tax=Cucurbitaria berberidis CBS 394.84 TaxID=1168544 RepID=A0A9P4GJ70_9PLEO|nr:2,5-diketo-D-gluconic acid reductase A [Cucurbitaria berberidis CBS 394.84]KAF1846146.1 2,5-diketo-D-gluconic acid reductase A [Cucurbitaria berberidis CBS 394.84]